MGARQLRVHGVVQGVGFRPFVYRLATAHHLTGWVFNGSDGVDIHVEGPDGAIDAFAHALVGAPPPAAAIVAVDVGPAVCGNWPAFEIREGTRAESPTTRISPDLPTCDDCLEELFNAVDRRSGYPYINCTACGPRYSIVQSLPYDRARTTMAAWPLCGACQREYETVGNRRFHAQPVACPLCGPHYRLELFATTGFDPLIDRPAIAAAARLLQEGAIVAVKGIGGYHVACDATNHAAVRALRERKFRKERPFAIMAKDIDAARRLVALSPAAERLMQSTARPIVVAPARTPKPDVSPDNADLGVMLPYAPVHYLLFASAAPAALVMTSGNRSSEPIAYDDDDARARLKGIADAILVGDRPIARRVDDSVVRAGDHPDRRGPTILRRAPGMAPGVVARLPVGAPILAVGADLKNAPTLVVSGEALVGQHIGDLDDYQSRVAYEQALNDLTTMYGIESGDLIVAHDLHPEYASTALALARPAKRHVAVQHHRAHIASVLAARSDFETRVVGVAFDGTGYGDDGSIWGGELFVGSVREGFTRVAHMRPATLVGGDAAAKRPVQAAAGFVSALDDEIDPVKPPFAFPTSYRHARKLACNGLRVYPTTSIGRLFDTVAALVGFTRPVTFEGQAAMWLEHLARGASGNDVYPLPFDGRELDYRPALLAVIARRKRGDDPSRIARAFHRGLARSVGDAVLTLAESHGTDTVALSGGVFQNALLLSLLYDILTPHHLHVWTNHEVPANDGGISLGQAAIAATARGPIGGP